MQHSDDLYLGRQVGNDNEMTDIPVGYPLDHLTTHGLLIGATGSGKTGLGLVLVEETLRHRIPVLLVDIKGDLTNLLLTFPELSGEAFAPWIDADAATRHGQRVDEAAADSADRWRTGLENWDLGPEDIAELREHAEITLVTPGMRAGEPVDILARFSAPPETDPDETVLRAQGLASALLGLAGVEADPLRNREHILLTNLIRHSWENQGRLDLPSLIRQVQSPPIDHVGVFDLESFFPQKERFDLALMLNNLIAAPGFEHWREGDPLDIARFLAPSGDKARATIFYLAHLPEDQRSFFLTLFLEELRTWVRQQAGTRVLRALLFFDEVYGYLPPHPYNPPTKTPLMALVKQGRAAGLGVVLSTQNPADLDYKGLGNIGTWFVGNLRTERDKRRVLEGMEGAITAGNRRVGSIETALSRLEPRVFLMHDAIDGRLTFFHSRWAMSYLRGPLTSAEVRHLLADSPALGLDPFPQPEATPTAVPVVHTSRSSSSDRLTGPTSEQPPQVDGLEHPPSVDPAIPQVYLPATITAAWALRNYAPTHKQDGPLRLIYRPHLLGAGVARILNDRANLSINDEQIWRIAPSDERWKLRWEQGKMLLLNLDDLSPKPPTDGIFSPLPRAMARKSDYPKWESALVTHIYHNSEITLWGSTALKLYSRPSETKGAFLTRCRQEIEARKQSELAGKRRTFARRMAALETKIRREELELDKDETRLQERRREELLSGAESVLTIFSRRRRSTRALSQTSRQRRYVNDAQAEVEESEEMLELYDAQATELEKAWQATAASISETWDARLMNIHEITVRAKRRDIAVRFCGLAWFPFWEAVIDGESQLLPAYVPQ